MGFDSGWQKHEAWKEVELQVAHGQVSNGMELLYQNPGEAQRSQLPLGAYRICAKTCSVLAHSNMKVEEQLLLGRQFYLENPVEQEQKWEEVREHHR